MRGYAYSYLRINPNDVIATPWERLDGGRTELLPEYVADWDYASYARVRRRVRVNMPVVASTLDFAVADLKLGLTVTVGTGGSRGADRYTKIYWLSELAEYEPESEIEFIIEGINISQRLTLRTELLLNRPIDAGGPLSPKRRGLRLWEDTLQCWVEPREPRFPVEAISFRSNLPQSSPALWKLEWSPGPLTDDFDSAFRLLVNEDDPEFISRVVAGDATTLQLIMASVRVQIARGVLANDAFTHDAGERRGVSIAAAVGRWLDQAFPNQSVEALRRMADLDPSQFDTSIAALTNLASGVDA
jgi:hypothetical protein